MPLQEYRRKRHFSVTSEPAGKQVKSRQAKRLSYVIQKHDATRLHYDFRLELDGVLKSWAVPKGPALDPKEKRLAVEVEDHPLEYAKFEGHIPEGEYGAGEVIVWDRGQWEAIGDPHEGLKKGNLKFTLEGEKLSGAWALVRIKGKRAGDRGNKNNWLLIKKQDDVARSLSEYDVTESLPQSVKSGKVLGQPAPKKRAAKKSAQGARRKRSKSRPRDIKSKAAKEAKLPSSLELQLATLTDKPPQGEGWVYEVKFDGYRMLCYLDDGQIKLVTRNQLDWTHRYPAVVEAAQTLDAHQAVLDGEIVAMLPSGVTSFQALQNAAKGAGEAKLAYYAFDLLYLDGYDLRRMPLVERKQLLEKLVAEANEPALLYSEHFDNSGVIFLRECCKMGLEGIIAKRANRPYLGGRGEDWLKIKCLGREELVIGGYTLSTAMQRGIGALLVGYFEGDNFCYAGRVGTGFSHALLVEMRERLSKIERKECPFESVPAKERGRNVRWVEPRLVAEIEFTGWTDGGVLRHPSFQGLREDKPAKAVTRPASLKLEEGRRGEGTKGRREETMAKKKSAKKATTKKVSDETADLPANLHVRLTNPDRVLYPESGLTKLGLATYYAQVGQWMLPYVLDRPLSLVRCPGGMASKCFYQKHVVAGTPEALGRVMIKEKDETEEYTYIKDLEGLVSLAQLSILEIHPWGSRRDEIEKPDYLIFDLDPDPSVPWKRVVDAAIEVRQVLEEMEITSFVKTTGGKGLHIVMPLSPRRYEWDQCKAFAREVSEKMVAASPALYTTNMAKAARKGKIFIDYLRNGRGATAVAPYSTRAKPGATVSVPLAWDELSASLPSDHYHVGNVLRRLQSLESDPWKEFFKTKQGLPKR